MEIKIADTELKEITSIFYRILIPRPIAWVSTISKKGIDNLAPFSFYGGCLLYTSPSPRDEQSSRMPSSA